MQQAWLVKCDSDDDWHIVFSEPDPGPWPISRPIVFAELKEGKAPD